MLTIPAALQAQAWEEGRNAAKSAAQSVGSPVGASDGWGARIPGTSGEAAQAIAQLQNPYNKDRTP
jgi:hypothetical protein